MVFHVSDVMSGSSGLSDGFVGVHIGAGQHSEVFSLTR